MLKIESDFIYLTCTEQQARKLDAIYVKSKKQWKLPNTLGALRELHKLGFDVMEYGKKKAEAREKLLQIKSSDPTTFQDKRLRPYQQTDINFLGHLPHAGVFNEQRTGKSVTVLKAFETEGRKKNLIVCPASLVLNWTAEIKKFTNKTPFPVSGTKTKRMKIYNAFKAADEGYLIMSKELLRQDVESLRSL
jgi:SNF2 family DNA or RNA helicase